MTRPHGDESVQPILDRVGEEVVSYDRTGLDHESLFAGFALAGLLARPDNINRPDLRGITDLAWEAAGLMCHRLTPTPPPVEQLREITTLVPAVYLDLLEAARRYIEYRRQSTFDRLAASVAGVIAWQSSMALLTPLTPEQGKRFLAGCEDAMDAEALERLEASKREPPDDPS